MIKNHFNILNNIYWMKFVLNLNRKLAKTVFLGHISVKFWNLGINITRLILLNFLEKLSSVFADPQ